MNESRGNEMSNKNSQSVRYDNRKGDLLYDALVEIIDDHMPEVFDEDLVDNDQSEKRMKSDNSR